MASNFVQPGGRLELAAPYDRVAGQGALIGTAIFGVALVDVLSTKTANFAVEGVWWLAKVSAQEWTTVGTKIYWDNSAKLCTTTSGGNTLIGTNVAFAANPSSIGQVRLNGVF